MASTAGLNSLAHSLTFGINLALFTNLLQYIYSETKLRRASIQPGWKKWGPFYCVLCATVGVMADLTRHLINDANNWSLASPSGAGDKVKFDLGNCEYTVPEVTGSDQCATRGMGPFVVQEENALGIAMSMYNDDGSLSVYGWLFTIVGTWTGFALLFVGISWYADLASKMRAQFANLRGHSTRVANEEAQEAFLTPLRDNESGFITPLSEPGSPAAA